MEREVAADPMVPVAMKVSKVGSETADTLTVELVPPAGRFEFEPGQFNMLYLFGIGEVPISISGDPARPERIVHTTRAVGAVSRAICDLRKGDSLGVRGPFGRGWPVAEAAGRDVLVIAGGVGLAPLRPAIYHLLNNRQLYGSITILYGVRTPRDILFREELAVWREREDLAVAITVDAADHAWTGAVGVVTRLIARQKLRPGTIALLCGPEIMMHYSIHELLGMGVAPEAIHLTMERSMKCAIGYCGHCQFGPLFVCKDGPVFRYDAIAHLLRLKEI